MVQTQKFGVTLLVKDLGSKRISKFSFKTTATMMKAGVDVGTDDMLMNYTHKVIFIKMRQNHNFETWRIEGECFQESLIIPLNSTSSHSHLCQQ